MQVRRYANSLPEDIVMTQPRTQPGLTRFMRINFLVINRVIFPVLISFLSISLFLFLSYMIIEGYSIVQMVKKDRSVVIMKNLQK
jgi:hypothetical protein